MDETPGRSRTVRATRSIFGESIGGRKLEKIGVGTVLEENLSPEMKQLAKSDMDRLKERKASVDDERARAEAELSRARFTAWELERLIEQTKARATSKRSELNAMSATRASQKVADAPSSPEERDAAEYAEVVQELDRAKQELSRLRLEVKSAAEAKAKAESDIVASAIKIQTDLRAADEMKRLVDEANEEHVLVELARIEAEWELREIDAQRRAQAERFAREMEETRTKVEALRKDASRVREMEAKLAVTNRDVEVLQAEMELVRAMERNSAAKNAVENKEEAASLQAAEAELDAARKELESVKAGEFEFMSSMDSTRTEIMRVAEEVSRLRALEKKADAQVQQLNAKLLKARARKDAAAAAAERSGAIVSNLTSALRQLRDETDAANKEKELTEMEQRCVRAETETVKTEIAVNEVRISQSVKELEAAKAAEAAAMKRLKSAVESTMQARASTQGPSGTINISRFEYEYLTGRAALVRVVAEKKVSAAQAWVQALRAGEKELAARAEAAEREAREAAAEEARAVAEAERAAAEQRALEQELYDLSAAAERDGLLCAYPPRRPATRTSATMRRARARRSSVSSMNGAGSAARPPSFAIKRKRKVMPNLMKLIRERRDNGASN
ncbi:hypothetical protein EJB05_17349 [Eragrostis curvula]|uniref:Uncharacterized protein n=1 Tax=Eragrostis curvula TaxID=38414 RepID=A0A5J9VGZ4_9POAL|nr:hypothetical protein EJB05_17349 [Eragrostis curvula]